MQGLRLTSSETFPGSRFCAHGAGEVKTQKIRIELRKASDFNISTSDAINESQPRVIEDARARKLATDLKRCAYYETCATYGLNVERVFQDGEDCFPAFNTEAGLTGVFQPVRRSARAGPGPAPPHPTTTQAGATRATCRAPPTDWAGRGAGRSPGLPNTPPSPAASPPTPPLTRSRTNLPS